MVRALPIILLVGFTVLALVDCVQTDRTLLRRKWLWLLAILLVPLLGPIAWFVLGRPRKGPAPPPRRQSPPVAPDDDPDFLRRIWPPNDPRDIV